MDASSFKPAADIDPVYADALARVVKNGVEVIARSAVMSRERISMGEPLPVMLTS
jgi:sugar fermentation stimulation protein A